MKFDYIRGYAGLAMDEVKEPYARHVHGDGEMNDHWRRNVRLRQSSQRMNLLPEAGVERLAGACDLGYSAGGRGCGATSGVDLV